MLFAKELRLPKELPYKSNFLTIDGCRLHYIDEGSGPAVLLLHGNPTWCFFYRGLIEALRDRFRVIAPDHIGCGLSDHPPDAHFRAVDRIAHLQRLLEHLAITRYSLVMHDWGGAIGTGLAVRNIEAVEKLVYLNTTLTEIESLPGIIKTAATPVIGKMLTKYTMRFLKLTTSLGVCSSLSPEVRAGYYLPYQSAARRTAIWGFVADIPFESDHPSYADMVDLASKIPLLAGKPAQIVWGLKDPCFHRGILSKVSAHFPHARILEIPEASHLVLEDAPALAFRTISEFLLEERHEPQKPLAARSEPAPISSGFRSMYTRFVEAAERDPQRNACIEAELKGEKGRYRHVSCRELRARINQYQRGLKELGLETGDRVLMLAPPGSEFLALSYAVMARGAVPVFVDPGMGRENLLKCIADCAPHAVIGVPKVQIVRWLRPSLFRNIRFFLSTHEWMPFGDAHLGLLKRYSAAEIDSVPVEEDAPGLIAFTSGATGTPKGVIFTNRMLSAQLDVFEQQFGLREGSDLPLLPIFSLFTLPLGITSVFAPLDPGRPLALDPKTIITIIQELGVSYSFGSPTLWNKLSEYCVRNGEVLPTIRKVFMAGAPVPLSTLDRVTKIVPRGDVYTPYGATEALPVTLVSAAEIRGHAWKPAVTGEQGTLVGRCIAGLELRVITPAEGGMESLPDPLPPLHVGEILVCGPTVSPAYLNRPDANKAAKIRGPDGALWHRLGDMGYVDEEGFLYFCGRKVHSVRAGERTFYSIPIERIFNEHPHVRRSALVRLKSGGAPAVVVEPLPQFWPKSEERKEKFHEELRRMAEANPLTHEIQRFFFHESFPVDARHNAKIFRDKLGDWASEIDVQERNDRGKR